MSVDYEIPKNKRITVKTLNVKSIEDAIAEVKGRKRYTEKRIREIAYALGKRGEEIAKQKCREYTNGSGKLEKSIRCEVKFNGGKFKVIIHMDTPYAAYVEFGTGIFATDGSPGAHPNKSRRKWLADAGKDKEGHLVEGLGHGEAGWVYRDDDGDFYWTQGQPAKPIMWETVQQLNVEFPSIVKEVFSH